MSEITIKMKECVTPEFRVSFPAIFEPKSFEGKEAKYSLVMLFDKKTDLSGLKKAAENAAFEKWGPKEKRPKNLRNPFRDGDTKADSVGYEGTLFVTASSKQKPALVNLKLEPIIVKEDFYAGCYARASLIAYAYDHLGNKGIGFALQGIQKLKDGESFSGRKQAKDMFTAIDDDSDNPENFDSNDMGF